MRASQRSHPRIDPMTDIIPISTSDKRDFLNSLDAVSTWSHSVNQHNGFWEELEFLQNAVANGSDRDNQDGASIRMKREIVLGRIALIHSEQSEAVEAVRKHGFEEWFSTEKDSFVSEMAGTVVGIMDLCEWLGVPLAEAIIAEVQRNEKRGKMHGGKAA